VNPAAAARRLLHRVACRAAGACRRVAEAAWRPPHEDAADAWRRADGDRTLRLQYDLEPASLVFDMGGYEGQWASDIHAMYRCRVEVFEPMPEYAARIAARFRRNDAIRVHPFGLASRTGEARLALAGDASSLFGKSDGAGSPAEARVVRLVEAASYLSERGIERIDLMKVNIEGGEYDLLEHLLDAGLVERIRELQVQFHDCLPDAAARMRRIQERLAATHRLTWQYPFVWENWRLTKA
jgi:FkbM family methyltransferase